MKCPNCKKEAKEYPGGVTVCADCGPLKVNPDGTAEPCECPPEPATAIEAAKTIETADKEVPGSGVAAGPAAGNDDSGINIHFKFEDE